MIAASLLILGLAGYTLLAQWLERRNDKQGLLSALNRIRAIIAYEGDPWHDGTPWEKEKKAAEWPVVVGQYVKKEGGDYRFYGVIVCVFKKQSGAIRVVAENQDGVVHIFNPSQLTPWEKP